MMTSGFARLARKVGVAICLLVVGGCGLTDQENMWICSKLPDLNPSEVFKLNPRERLNRCIVKWGYRLSRAPDPARTVADATFANCSGLLLEAQEFRIAEWNGNAASINRDADLPLIFHPAAARVTAFVTPCGAG